ncbi:gfo/Idh/MocA family oxidoreductase [Roseobacter denitrificans]|uniref:Probable NADH-dependent dyhydrogenase n=1 Tax=Roseobacter denitrificans (strain ATCC 33942 / OCh 114) TaxID=375451 RepID=Q161T7_ROSDO|nr:Gfo/Idh/MocA family oxidoreductase [Roseobacter denitrificans]ABG33256.1 probable NADH-dependent dyhydrogenase [Roseobacter denitrificans OCh 114]AVL52597.1 gfo/Idh/MocA family oxidoreductase [Roseobacter denitrificans]SFG30690.1 Predicted dehydrogenase [Roseobacter denitrificans OCh 114]
MSEPLRVACVGAGYVSQFHLGSWARIKDVKIIGVADTKISAAQATGYRAYADAGEMIQHTSPDILDIILPPPAQAATIDVALRAGVKTIICQKPFCTSLEQAREAVAQAARAQARLIVHENFRFMPWYRAIKAEIARGGIGDVHQAVFRLRPGDGQGPDAYLDRQPYFQQMPAFLVHETAVHWIDTFRYLFGDPVSVYADLRRLNPAIAGEDAGYIIFEHAGGVRSVFDGNRHLDHASDNLRRTMGEALIEGTAGVLSHYGDGRVEKREFGSADAAVLLPPDPWDGFGGDCVHALQSHVIAGLRGRGIFENEAAAYCDVIRIRDAIYQSAQCGAKVDLR